MERKIQWESGLLDEIELVYEYANQEESIGKQLSALEEQALNEVKANCGKGGLLESAMGAVLTPEQFDSMSGTDREKAIRCLAGFGLADLETDLANAVIKVRFSAHIQQVLACTIFDVLNRLEKLDGAVTVLHPKWTLALQVPLGGKKGLLQWEMLIMQLYPWISVHEESSNEMAANSENIRASALKTEKASVKTAEQPTPKQPAAPVSRPAKPVVEKAARDQIAAPKKAPPQSTPKQNPTASSAETGQEGKRKISREKERKILGIALLAVYAWWCVAGLTDGIGGVIFMALLGVPFLCGGILFLRENGETAGFSKARKVVGVILMVYAGCCVFTDIILLAVGLPVGLLYSAALVALMGYAGFRLYQFGKGSSEAPRPEPKPMPEKTAPKQPAAPEKTAPKSKPAAPEKAAPKSKPAAPEQPTPESKPEQTSESSFEQLTKVYIPVIAVNQAFPVVTQKRVVCVFARLEDAQAFMQKNAPMLQKIAYRETTRQGLQQEMSANWLRWGIQCVIVHSTGLEKTWQFQQRYAHDPEGKLGPLPFAFLSLAQSKHCIDSGSDHWKGTVGMSRIMLALGQQSEAFLMPACYDGEPFDAGKGDRVLRLLPGAAALRTRLLEQGKDLNFFGMKETGYHFRGAGEAGDSRTLHGRTVVNPKTGQEAAAVFTDFYVLKKMFGDDTYVMAGTWEDVLRVAGNAPVVLNPGELNYFPEMQDFSVKVEG